MTVIDDTETACPRRIPNFYAGRRSWTVENTFCIQQANSNNNMINVLVALY